MTKFTFKKQPPTTGLASVAKPYPDTDIKYNKKKCGYISAPSRFGRHPDHWNICLMVLRDGPVTEEEPCEWRWAFLKGLFDTEGEAREFLIKNQEIILQKYSLHYQED